MELLRQLVGTGRPSGPQPEWLGRQKHGLGGVEDVLSNHIVSQKGKAGSSQPCLQCGWTVVTLTGNIVVRWKKYLRISSTPPTRLPLRKQRLAFRDALIYHSRWSHQGSYETPWWKGKATTPPHISRSQMRWIGHLFQMPPRRLPGEVFKARLTRKRPRGRPRSHWRVSVSQLAWEWLRIHPEELEEVASEREVWASLLWLLP